MKRLKEPRKTAQVNSSKQTYMKHQQSFRQNNGKAQSPLLAFRSTKSGANKRGRKTESTSEITEVSVIGTGVDMEAAQVTYCHHGWKNPVAKAHLAIVD